MFYKLNPIGTKISCSHKVYARFIDFLKICQVVKKAKNGPKSKKSVLNNKFYVIFSN